MIFDVIYSNNHMGLTGSKTTEEPPPTPEIIDRNIQLLFEESTETSKIEEVNQPIIIISRNLSQEGSFQSK